jgi:C-methyltransferase
MTPYACRICGSADHDLVLDFGAVALADAFLASPDDVKNERRYPLTLVLCRRCLHLQIKEVLDPALLFSHYVWETGVPASIRRYCSELAEIVLGRRAADGTVAAKASIVEIASNDGTMLKEFKTRGCDVIGIDPARNIAENANAAGIPTIADFFGKRVARAVLAQQGPIDICIARNVLAHVAHLHEVIAGMALLLKESGLGVIEVPHLLTMYQELQYDQVFHEHVGYHSLDSIVRLFGMHDLQVFDVEYSWLHGGSLRVYAGHARADRQPTRAVERTLAEERAAGILDLNRWKCFAERVRTQKRLLQAQLESLRAANKVVVGYGASAKGQSMIQYCELDDALVKYIADKSTMKIGKLTPGSHIAIVAPERMRADSVDVVLLFAWNFAAEVLEQEQSMYERGVRFLHPIPEPHYL